MYESSLFALCLMSPVRRWLPLASGADYCEEKWATRNTGSPKCDLWVLTPVARLRVDHDPMISTHPADRVPSTHLPTIGHLRNGVGRDERHCINMLESRADQGLSDSPLSGEWGSVPSALPGIAGTLDKFCYFCHMKSLPRIPRIRQD